MSEDVINEYAATLEARGCKTNTINTRRYQLARVLRRDRAREYAALGLLANALS